MNTVNSKTDFSFILQLNALNAPLNADDSFDFVGRLFCVAEHCIGRVYTFCRRGDTFVNCRFVEEGLLVMVADHSLGQGRLICELQAFIPDADFPKEVRRVTEHIDTEIQIVE